MKRVQMMLGTILAAMLLTTTASAISPKVTFKLTAEQQALNDVEVKPHTFQSTTTKIKITNKDILNRLASFHLTTYPEGTILKINSALSDLYVYNENGVILTAVSPFDVQFSHGTSVSQMRATTPPLPYKSTTKSSVVFEAMFDLGTSLLQFNLTGVEQLQVQSNHDTGYEIKSFSAAVSGGGYFDGNPAVFTGTISGNTTYPI